MDRLFDDSFNPPFGMAAGLQDLVVDLCQTEDEVVVRASMPGMKADDVQISVTENCSPSKAGSRIRKRSRKNLAICQSSALPPSSISTASRPGWWQIRPHPTLKTVF